MALNRITGLGMIVLGSCMLYAACDSGGTTGTPANGGAAATGGAGNPAGGGATGGAGANTGGAITSTTGGAGNAGGNAPTGGSSTASSKAKCDSSITPPTGTGTLSVAAGYVTTGTLKGYGFTWVGDKSNSTSCVTPQCDTTGCLPSFGATALCGAGVVTMDTSYNSVVGIGFNLNQPNTGGNPVNTIPAPATVTVTTSVGSDTGDAAARVQIVGADGNSYCVEAGKWSSGSPITITDFNTHCWNTAEDGAVALAQAQEINAIDITVPSDSTSDRKYSICLLGVSM
jgi:hypothetical protein